jgi:Cdc6-like AAA superfamily ATPase
LIIAGYTNEMKRLIDMNPGFESRIKEYLHFPDYNAIEMRDIIRYMANKHDFVIDMNAYDVYDALVARERRLKSFGNGRTARNILDKAIDKHTLNLATGVLTQDDRYCLKSQDFQNLKLGTISAGFDRGYGV